MKDIFQNAEIVHPEQKKQKEYFAGVCANKTCGKQFIARHPAQRYCCEQCKNESKKRAYYKDKVEYVRRCLWCNKEFITTRSAQQYCCVLCRRQHYKVLRAL